jgi:hypothetical protein
MKIVSLRVGPDLDEGGSYRAIFSIKVGETWQAAMVAEYGGSGGPVDICSIIMGETKKAIASKTLFDQAWEYTLDLAKRTKHAQDFDLDTAAEITVGEMVDDYNADRDIRRLLAAGKLVGIRADRGIVRWSRRNSNAADLLKDLPLEDRREIVEWAHETLSGPAVHPLPPYVDNLYQPPPDLPCLVCGEMIDRKHSGTHAVVCRSIMCDCLNQEVMHGARNMVMNGTERPEAHLYHMRVGLGGHGSQGPIGSMVRLAIEINNHEWPSPAVRQKAIHVLQGLNEAYRILHYVSVETATEMHKPLEVPTMGDMQDLSDKFPAMLEVALKEERLRKDDDD